MTAEPPVPENGKLEVCESSYKACNRCAYPGSEQREISRRCLDLVQRYAPRIQDS